MAKQTGVNDHQVGLRDVWSARWIFQPFLHSKWDYKILSLWPAVWVNVWRKEHRTQDCGLRGGHIACRRLQIACWFLVKNWLASPPLPLVIRIEVLGYNRAVRHPNWPADMNIAHLDWYSHFLGTLSQTRFHFTWLGIKISLQFQSLLSYMPHSTSAPEGSFPPSNESFCFYYEDLHIICEQEDRSILLNITFHALMRLELIYLYFPPSSHLICVCFCPVGLSLL